MSRQYSYPPPPPPPPPSAPSPAGSYPPSAYGQNSPYTHASRGGGGMAGGNGAGAGRGRGGHHAPAYGSYAQQDYASHSPAPYANQTPNSYWGSSPPATLPTHGSTPLPQSNYHPNYAPQAYATQPHPAYQPSPYPPNPQQPYPPSYTPGSGEYPPRQWGETGSPYSPYPSRGGRGAFQGDRGGHRSDHGSGPPIRMGFDQNAGHATQASNGYGQTYPPPPQHHASPAYPVPSYPYAPPPMPAPAYSGPASAPYSSHGHRGRGRDGSGGNFRGRSHHHNDRGGDKFRHRGQRPHQDHNNSAQKSDPSSSKKKKRKTNTLGLTPGDGDESADESGDEEKRLVDLLGADAPVVPDLAAWIAERRANFPTRARIQAKKAAEEARRAEVGEEPKPATKLDKDEEKAEKLRRQLAKVERKLEKRKREANDEGDEMRVDGADSSASDSDDGKPETMSARKPPSFLPPPPITRADPTNHCKYYSTGGICGKKGKCRFVHDNQVREQALREQAANGGRLTLNQRLLRNDKDQEDLAIVQSIVDLRSSGRLAKSEKSANTKTVPSEQRTHPLPAKVEAASLPLAPDVLPDGRVKSAYTSPEVQDIFNGLKPLSNKD